MLQQVLGTIPTGSHAVIYKKINKQQGRKTRKKNKDADFIPTRFSITKM
jgi:hypothetical protein